MGQLNHSNDLDSLERCSWLVIQVLALFFAFQPVTLATRSGLFVPEELHHVYLTCHMQVLLKTSIVQGCQCDSRSQRFI
jgi:hypothetical protein